MISCKKYSARKLEGHYYGTIRQYIQQPGEPLQDETTPGGFVVTRDKHTITVLGNTVHEDSLQDGYYSFINPSGAGGTNFIEIKEDSMIARAYDTYKFGYIRFTEVRGTKEK